MGIEMQRIDESLIEKCREAYKGSSEADFEALRNDIFKECVKMMQQSGSVVVCYEPTIQKLRLIETDKDRSIKERLKVADVKICDAVNQDNFRRAYNLIKKEEILCRYLARPESLVEIVVEGGQTRTDIKEFTEEELTFINKG